MTENCATCRTFGEENNALAREIQALDADRKRLALENAALRAQETKRRYSEQITPHVIAVLRLHHKLLGSRLFDKEGNVLLDGKNAEIVRVAFKKYTVGSIPERRHLLMDAVRGLALRPYVGPRGRTANPNGATRYAHLKYALGDEDRISDHAGFYRDSRLKPLEWKQRAWDAATEIERRYMELYLGSWREEEERKRREGESPGKPQLHLVVDNTERKAA